MNENSLMKEFTAYYFCCWQGNSDFLYFL